eukprot:scpid51517/ scgid5696/ 
MEKSDISAMEGSSAEMYYQDAKQEHQLQRSGYADWVVFSVRLAATSSSGESTVNERTELASAAQPIPVRAPLVHAVKVTTCTCGKQRLESQTTCQLCSFKAEAAAQSRPGNGAEFVRRSFLPPCYSSSSSPSGSSCSPPALCPSKKPGLLVQAHVLPPLGKPSPELRQSGLSTLTLIDPALQVSSASSSGGASTPQQVERHSTVSATVTTDQSSPRSTTTHCSPSDGLSSAQDASQHRQQRLEPIQEIQRHIRTTRRRSFPRRRRNETESTSTSPSSSSFSSSCEFCPAALTLRMSGMRLSSGAVSIAHNANNSSSVDLRVPPGAIAVVYYPTRDSVTDPIGLAHASDSTGASMLMSMNRCSSCGTPSVISRELSDAALQLPSIHQQSTTMIQAFSEARPSDDRHPVERSPLESESLSARSTLYRSDSLGALPQSRPKHRRASRRRRPSSAMEVASRPLQGANVPAAHIVEGEFAA